jgi:hypothetical protein
MRWGGTCLAEVWSRVRGKPRQGGALGVLPTHDRHGPSQPPRPMLAPRGGGAPQAQPWHPLDDGPAARVRPKGPGHLLTRLRQRGKTPERRRGGGYVFYARS